MAPIRENWSSRAAFIVSSVGAAIGFGNVWRFPNLAFEFGGGAFFIPYLLALFLIGIPLLMLEVSVGQFYQTGDAGAFGRINKRFRGIGLSSVICSFVVTLYYSQLLVWTLRMFVYSCIGSEGRWKDVSGVNAAKWFKNVVTGLETVGPDNAPTRLVGPNVGALAIVWISVFLCLAFGVKWTGRIAYFTVGLPVLFLFILLIRAVTLDGAGDGVKAYIGEWDVGVLREKPEVWTEAVTQVFFSLSVTFGVMTAFASYNKRNEPVFSNSVIIALANSAYSVIAGFAVFGAVGYIAQLEEKTIQDLQDEEIIGGPSLVFATYPLALSTLPGHGHWERLFFVALFLLGIDSAFALSEAFITVISDSYLLRNVPRYLVVGAVCIISFLLSLVYATDTGLIFLDTTDNYVNYMMLLVGFFESFSVGWIYGIERQIERIGRLATVGYLVAYFAPVVLASALWFGLDRNEVWAGFIALGAGHLVLLGPVGVCLLKATREGKSQSLTLGQAIKEMLVGNLLEFREGLVGVVRYIPFVWFLLVRFFIPPVLWILFLNLATSETKSGKSRFGHFGGFPKGYQAVGIFVFSTSLVVILVGLVFPCAYACFDAKAILGEQESAPTANEAMHDESNAPGTTSQKSQV